MYTNKTHFEIYANNLVLYFEFFLLYIEYLTFLWVNVHAHERFLLSSQTPYIFFNNIV